MKKFKLLLITLSLCVMFAFTLAACSGASTDNSNTTENSDTGENEGTEGDDTETADDDGYTPPEAEYEADDYALKIGVLSITDSLAIFLAENEGIFDAAGANVEIIEFGSASDQSKAMEAGEIDMMMTDPVVQMLIKKGGIDSHIIRTALGSTADEGKFLVTAAPESELKTTDDLKGKKIAISEDTMMEYLVDSYLEELGYTEGDIEKVSMPSLSLRFEALVNSADIDGAILPEPLGDLSVASGCTEIIDDRKLSRNYSVSVIIATDEVISEHPGAINAFCSAYDEAATLLNNDPDSYMELIYTVANVPEIIRDEYVLTKFAVNAVPDEEVISPIIEWMVNKGLIDTEYTFDEVVSSQFRSE